MNIITLALGMNDYGLFIFIAFIVGMIIFYKCYLGEKLRPFFTAHPLLRYCFKRTLASCITIFLIVTIVFLTLRMLPKSGYIDNQALLKFSPDLRPALREEMLKFYGLDKPIFEQLYNFYKNVLPYPKTICINTNVAIELGKTDALTGKDVLVGQMFCTAKKDFAFIDLGRSLIVSANTPVTQFISERWFVSFSIFLIALAIELIIGWTLGIFMAKHFNRAVDKVGIAYYSLVASIPMIVYYSLIATLFMAAGFATIYDSDNLITLIPPIVAMVFVAVPYDAIYIRRYMVDESTADYIKFARAKGLSENRIMFIHIFRNAMVPVVRTIPIAIIFCINGSYIVERMFSIPGLGSALVKAATKTPDNNLVQGLVLFYAIISIVAYLLGDIVTVLFDPRISLTENK